jgi:hypothetical protein
MMAETAIRLCRSHLLARLCLAGCELLPEVVRELDSEALAAHLRDCHGIGDDD